MVLLIHLRCYCLPSRRIYQDRERLAKTQSRKISIRNKKVNSRASTVVVVVVVVVVAAAAATATAVVLAIVVLSCSLDDQQN